ncbi:MAG: ABC transporter permease, partial [Kiloniellales bacterium]
MAAALRALSVEPTRSTRTDLLRFLPAVTLALFLAPVLAGLAGTVLPAFGYLPALGGDRPRLDAFARLAAAPGLATALRLTLVSGLAGTLAAVALTLGLLAACHQRPIFLRLRALLAPLLALPHAAVAIGLAFLIAPSGWIVRLLSPWATGWSLPPALPLLPDPWGLGLALGLVLKETPFLLLVAIAALTRIDSERRVAIARSLGYGSTVAWFKTVLPALYPQLRLPIYAVLAYALSTVDMAIVLGPTTPPPFAVQVLRWFYDPDLSLRFVAAAGALLQLLLVLAAILAWRLGEIAVARLGR